MNREGALKLDCIVFSTWGGIRQRSRRITDLGEHMYSSRNTVDMSDEFKGMIRLWDG